MRGGDVWCSIFGWQLNGTGFPPDGQLGSLQNVVKSPFQQFETSLEVIQLSVRMYLSRR
jgi:hypothetical protein